MDYPIAIISDVHANLEALESVLQQIKERGIKRILFLGDAVGYGPDPDRCVELIYDNCEVVLAGNHDWAVIGLTPLEYFNRDARLAAEWTATQIKERTRKLLEEMKIVRRLSKESLFLVHSTPKDPDAWNYILTLYDAEVNFQYFEEKICFIGHSHRPFIIERLPSSEMVVYNEKAEFKQSCRYMINAGSVGQPRDGDPRAAYVILDKEKAEILRVEYDFRKTQEKMENIGLPEFLIERLEKGI